MKYKLKTNKKIDDIFDIKEYILNNRGIINIESFLNPKEMDCISYTKLNNINKATEKLLYHLNNDGKICIVVDCDCDGMTSSALLWNYIKNIYPNSNLIHIHHKEKQHGLYPELIIPKDVNLIILPDGTSTSYEEYEKYNKLNIDVILLDHHLADKESEYAIVVNNQLSPEYINKDLSGVGVTYKFCKALDDLLWNDFADNYLDLVALGNIADTMDSRNPETRYYMVNGLNKIKNNMIKAFIEEQEYSLQGEININSIAFYVCPLINALIRMGNQSDKELMFRAFIGDYEEFENRGKKENIYQRVARLCTNAKARQSKKKDDAVELLDNKIKEDNLNENKILIINTNNEIDKSLTGLIAQNIVSKYKKPVLLGTKKNGKYGGFVLSGSGRNLNGCEIESFKKYLGTTNLFNFVEGHDNAFGFEIDYDKIPEFVKKSNNDLSNVVFDNFYEVDLEISAEKLSENIFETMFELKDIWGSNVVEPLFIIKNVIVDLNSIQEMGNGKHYKFNATNNINKIEFINFNYSNKNEDDKLISMITGWDACFSKAKINIIGKIKVNIYNGKSKFQISIEDYEIVEKIM